MMQGLSFRVTLSTGGNTVGCLENIPLLCREFPEATGLCQRVRLKTLMKLDFKW